MQVNTETSKFEINNNPVTDISYAIGNSPFGDFFIAATKVGICQLDFLNPDAITDSVSTLSRAWPLANITHGSPQFLTSVEAFFQGQYCDTKQLSLHMTGTDFQIKVWQALLKIPASNTTTYTDIAQSINHPKAVRAVGTAVGSNPVAFFVPCHRVIRSDGTLGGYRWGASRKQAILNWEKRW
jgi:AraC family transcriptional regulator of adaptative response/methylated-DNA-[protein]-cysteine methyltransferase